MLYCFACLLLLVINAQAQRYKPPIPYVKQVATGRGDGSSWDNASGDLQATINNAPHRAQIWIGGGTFKPTTGTDRKATFKLTNGVSLFGGFAGYETDPFYRDLSANHTILSGDLGNQLVIADNSYHVVTILGDSLPYGLSGLTIRDGYANGTSGEDYNGGGLLIIDGNTQVNVDYTFFINNSATVSGGAVKMVAKNDFCDPTFYGCVFYNNAAGLLGGATYFENPGGWYDCEVR